MLILNRSLLSSAASLSLTLFGLTLSAQTHETLHSVALKDEPRYRLIFENAYVRVFRANLLGHTATLTHRHDLPYVYVTIGPADFIDSVMRGTSPNTVGLVASLISPRAPWSALATRRMTSTNNGSPS